MPFGQEQEEIVIPPHDPPKAVPRVRKASTLSAPPSSPPLPPTTFGGIGSWLLSNSFVLIIGFTAGYLTCRYLNRGK